MKLSDAIDRDTPLRLDVAARVAFPRGGVTAVTLRKAAKRGQLVIERIGGKDFTTLNHIADMRKLCRVNQSRPDSISNPSKEMQRIELAARPLGLSLMEVANSELAVALGTLRERSKR